jgi:hypothetical protein
MIAVLDSLYAAYSAPPLQNPFWTCIHTRVPVSECRRGVDGPTCEATWELAVR